MSNDQFFITWHRNWDANVDAEINMINHDLDNNGEMNSSEDTDDSFGMDMSPLFSMISHFLEPQETTGCSNVDDIPKLADCHIGESCNGLGGQLECTDDVDNISRTVHTDAGDFVCDRGVQLRHVMNHVIDYLGTRELHMCEMVCREFRILIKENPSISRNILFAYDDKITDDILLELTNRAQGNLHSLTLVCCNRITNTGLNRILENNPGLVKLFVPGCSTLYLQPIVEKLRAFKSMGILKLKHIKVLGIRGVKWSCFVELKLLLGTNDHALQNDHRPQYYHSRIYCYYHNDDHAIDIEACPRCQHIGAVYDCPDEGCQSKEQANQKCRACLLCIKRCVLCGRCRKGVYYDVYSGRYYCLDCDLKLWRCYIQSLITEVFYILKDLPTENCQT